MTLVSIVLYHETFLTPVLDSLRVDMFSVFLFCVFHSDLVLEILFTKKIGTDISKWYPEFLFFLRWYFGLQRHFRVL